MNNYPGWDAFILEFYETYWNVIKDDMFYCIIRLLRGQNKSGTKNKSSKVPFKGTITDGTEPVDWRPIVRNDDFLERFLKGITTVTLPY